MQPPSQGHSCLFKTTEMTKSEPVTSQAVQQASAKHTGQTNACYRCGLHGHIRKYCPTKLQCYNCGGKGHSEPECHCH